MNFTAAWGSDMPLNPDETRDFDTRELAEEWLQSIFASHGEVQWWLKNNDA
jgi:hypothetical protein